jgi:aryl-alcohol dehydrogenase-like predicted oxidoreductase
MRLRTITGTDLHASVICLGALPFGVTLSEDLSFTLMDRFLAAGGNFIDTALVYGEWLPDGKGRSERTVGKWVKQRRTRDRVIIGTKGAHPRLSSMDVPRLARDEIVADLDESLGNLQTDYIDLYWLHRDDPRRPVAEILDTLNEQVERGKIRYFGCSNWRLDRIQAAQDYAAEHGIRGFAGNQLMWSLAVPNHAALFDPAMVTMDAATKAYHLRTGQAAMAYSSQAGGLFTRLASGAPDDLPAGQRALYAGEENLRRLQRLQQVAQAQDLPVGVVALAYLVSHPFPAYALSGCSNTDQLQQNLRAGDVELEPGALEYLERGPD